MTTPEGVAGGRRTLTLLVLLAALQPWSAGRGAAAAFPPEPPRSGGLQPSGEDSLVARYRERLEAGFALSVSRDLARLLSLEQGDPPPELVLLAARAHAAAGSPAAVRRLLAEREWLDTIGGGEGRLHLATAALELGDAAEAIHEYERFLEDERRGSGGTAAARVGYARALTMSGRHADAARAYRIAAAEEPAISEWLLLSALQSYGEAALPDDTKAVMAALREPRAVPRDSVWTAVALAHFRSGATGQGRAAADSLSRRGRAMLAGPWLIPALLAAGDTAGARQEAERALDVAAAGPEAGALLVSLDSSAVTLRQVAASDVRSGRSERAVALLSAAREKVPGSEKAELDLQLAEAHFAAAAYAAVNRVLGPWLAGPREAAELNPRTLTEVRFLAGRALYRRGRRDQAVELWEQVAEVPDAPDGAYASYLIADIDHEKGRLDRARSGYQRTVARFPRSAHAGTSLMRLGMLSLLDDRSQEAAEHFDSYRRRFPDGNWSHAATYWAARARDAMGDSAAARALYRQTLGEDPISYYGIEAGRRLGLEPWDHLPLRTSQNLPRLRPDHAALISRMQLLRELGWKERGLRELEARDRRGETWAVRAVLALALNDAGWTWQGTTLGWLAYRARSNLWSDELLRAMYPLAYRPVLEEVAARERLDPALLAALVRRESQFDRDVVSHASAVGLMQLLPRTGAEVARRAGIAEFRSSQLRVPEVNLTLGSRYLRDLLTRHGGSLVPALISYNAGPHRYAAWRSFPEFSADTGLLIERIPFTETRRYVKALIAYRYVYGRLYGLGAAPRTPPGGAG